MARVRVRKNGEWVDAVDTIADADTLDGRHASEFLLASKLTTSITEISTDDEVPSASAVFNLISGANINITGCSVTITENDGVYSSDKTFEEIANAILGDTPVTATYTVDDIAMVMEVCSYTEDSIYFAVASDPGSFFVINSDDTITFISGSSSADSTPTSVSTTKSGNTITVSATYEDGNTSTHIITLDDSNYPVSVLNNGVSCTLTWEGFDE